MRNYYVYILTNKNFSVLYIGVTNNLITRVSSHKNGEGSKFTKRYGLKLLIYFEEFSDINEAIRREKQLKKWNRSWKWDLIKRDNPDLRDLIDDIQD